MSADALLGCSYIDKSVRLIDPQYQKITTMIWEKVPISRRCSLASVIKELPERKQMASGPKMYNKIRMHKRVESDTGCEIELMCTVGSAEK